MEHTMEHTMKHTVLPTRLLIPMHVKRTIP